MALVSACLLAVAFLPLVIITLTPGAQGQQFMGAIHRYNDASTYLARMAQGAAGDWLIHLQHTPEAHRSALVNPVYTLMGHLSRWTFESEIIVFHVVRLLASLIMYLALYQLAAVIWVKVRSRRIFFILASLGGGLGWLVSLLSGETWSIDLRFPQAFPFFATLNNVHYPLAIALLSALAMVVVQVLRPAETEWPQASNQGLVAILASVGLGFVYPEAFLPFALAFVGAVLVQWWQARRFQHRELSWLMWTFIPIVPLLVYYMLTLSRNSTISLWIQQSSQAGISPLALLSGLILLLLLAMPSLWRAFRRLEADGDRFMLLWLLAMLVTFALILPFRPVFLTALTLPLAYFATRSIEDFWLSSLSRRAKRRWFVVGVGGLVIGPLYVTFVPIAPLIQGAPLEAMLPVQYRPALEWLRERIAADEQVVLASPRVSAWIPSWVGARVVYGHEAETGDAPRKLARVLEWYQASDPQLCRQLAQPQSSAVGLYYIDYAILGPLERELGDGACLQRFDLLASFGDVEVYGCDLSCKLNALTAPAP